MNSTDWNNPVSFELFFREHHKQMVFYAAKFVDDYETARDIVQEVFLKTWENREKVQISTSLTTYLFAAIRNQCINYVRHQSVNMKFTNETQLQLKELEISYYTSVEEQHLNLFEQETREKIQRTISTLPEKCRQIFSMSRFEGIRSNDIAKKLNISVRTVETQIYRALKEIKKKLMEP
jgi:RNA polymerase sigma-70 factor (ECF subfamily)